MTIAKTQLPERNLDLLRTVAVLCVIIDHAVGMRVEGPRFTQWMGHAGVLAFFVHTSLVLMASLERDGAPARKGWVTRFYVRRGWRIYPLAWAAILFTLALRIPPGSLRSTFEVHSAADIAANLALVQNLTGSTYMLSPLWTLPLEVQMYVMLPLLFLAARGNGFRWLLPLIIAGAVAGEYLYSYGVTPAHLIPGVWRLRLLAFIPCFLMGVLAYGLLKNRVMAPRIPAWIWPLIIALDIALLGVWYAGGGPRNIIRPLFCLVLGLAIPLVRDLNPSWLTRITHTIATYSYGIYLIHLLVLRLVLGTMNGQPRVVQALTFVVVLTASSYAAYHLIEKPGIAFGQRLVGKRGVKAPLESTAAVP